MTNWLPDIDPTVSRREIPDRQGKPYASGRPAHKFALMAHTDWVVPDWVEPPHLSLDLRSGQQSYQHVAFGLAAYGLGRGEGWNEWSLSNTDAGYLVTMCILGLSESDGSWWTQEYYNRLAYFLVKVGSMVGINPTLIPFPFYTTSDDPDANRVPVWDDWEAANGITGICHDPDSDGRWGPGKLNHTMLLDAVEREQAAQTPPAGDSGGPPENTGSVGESQGSSGDGSNDYTEYDISTKPFRFNPPLHRTFLPVRVDFSSTDPAGFQQDVYLVESTVPSGGTDASVYQPMRLGRLFQHEWAAGMAAVNDYRYGFRFLYNPTTITTAASRNDSIYIDPQSSISAVVSGINQNFQTIRFTCLLNRIADVGEGTAGVLTADAYYTDIHPEDLEKIMVYGTHWDLEYLYRMCNGMFTMQDRGKSGDIGVIVPSNARLLLGDENYFGFVESVAWNDQVFNDHMVPTLTSVDIVFRRHVDMAPEDLEDFYESMLQSGVAWDGSSSQGGGSLYPPTGDTSVSGGGGSHGDWPEVNSCCSYGGGAGGPFSGEPNVYGTYYVAPAIQQLIADLNSTFPDRDKGMDGTAGWGSNHVESDSDHNPVGHVHGPTYGSERTVHALDFAIAGLPVDRLLNNLKNDPRVQYYIHKSTIYSRVRGFTPSGNSDHDKHIHVSLRSDNQQIAQEVENDTERWVL